jgi:hypothetical protein
VRVDVRVDWSVICCCLHFVTCSYPTGYEINVRVDVRVKFLGNGTNRAAVTLWARISLTFGKGYIKLGSFSAAGGQLAFQAP